MKMLTFKINPKTLFGIILALTGVAVIALTFVNNHINKGTQEASAIISASTDKERRDYLASFGWDTESEPEQKQLTIPESWNDVYNAYNELQLNQGFDLSQYKGKAVTLYSYKITNYENLSEGVVADMLVCDGRLIGGDICNTAADDGFMVGFDGKN